MNYRYFKPNDHKEWNTYTYNNILPHPRRKDIYVVNKNIYGCWSSSKNFNYMINTNKLDAEDWRNFEIYYNEITYEEAFLELL